MKSKNKKIIIFTLLLTFISCFIGNKVYAKTVTKDEIQGPAYVIGTHVFTREVNEKTGYEGKLTTNLIMLASRTISSSTLDNMIIYYKTASGNWINGLNGTSINPPKSFEINYTNLQLEEKNNTVSSPKVPIISLNDGPLSIDEKSDMLYYQLNIYIDDIDEKLNKTDGVELSIVDNGVLKEQDLKYSDNRFSTITSISKEYDGDDLKIGKQYHSDFITLENKPSGYCNITARAYVKDANGKKIYSDSVYVEINPDTIFPATKIVNNYSNPDYVSFNESTYTYKLTIEQPEAYVFKTKPKKFAYIVCEKVKDGSKQIGIFGINETFTVEVPKDTIKTYFAKLGYYDLNGDFKYFNDTYPVEKYFTIDTRKTITTPILNLNQLDENYDYNRTYGDTIEVNPDIYKKADKDTLDYNVKGIEIYEVSYDGISMSNFKYIQSFNNLDSFSVYVKPKGGMATYVGRAYAINEVGEKVYSKYSDVLTVIRTPEIKVSDINNGKVNVSIKNIEEYEGSNDLKYKVFNASGDELTELVNLNDILSIDIDSTTQLFVRIYKASDDSGNIYSAKSNKVDVIVE